MALTVNELIERDIGRMVVRINTLVAQLTEAHDEIEKLKQRLDELTEVHSNGA